MNKLEKRRTQLLVEKLEKEGLSNEIDLLQDAECPNFKGCYDRYQPDQTYVYNLNMLKDSKPLPEELKKIYQEENKPLIRYTEGLQDSL